MKALVLDDEKSIREATGISLRGYQFKVFEAANVEMAKALCEVNDFDLILSDYNMPGQSGLDFYEYLKSHNKIKKNNKFVLISALLGEKELVRAINLGVRHVLSKPYMHDDLINILELKKPFKEIDTGFEIYNLCIGEKVSNFSKKNKRIKLTELAYFYHESSKQESGLLGQAGLSAIELFYLQGAICSTSTLSNITKVKLEELAKNYYCTFNKALEAIYYVTNNENITFYVFNMESVFLNTLKRVWESECLDSELKTISTSDLQECILTRYPIDKSNSKYLCNPELKWSWLYYNFATITEFSKINFQKPYYNFIAGKMKSSEVKKESILLFLRELLSLTHKNKDISFIFYTFVYLLCDFMNKDDATMIGLFKISTCNRFLEIKIENLKAHEFEEISTFIFPFHSEKKERLKAYSIWRDSPIEFLSFTKELIFLRV